MFSWRDYIMGFCDNCVVAKANVTPVDTSGHERTPVDKNSVKKGLTGFQVLSQAVFT
jgi:hypothetical protein